MAADGASVPAINKWRKGCVRFTDERRAVFLQQLEEHGLISHAARVAGISQETVRLHREKDPEFAEAMANAKQAFCDELERKAREYATGYEFEQVVNTPNGPSILTVRRYDSKMLALLLKRHIPAYREQREVEVSVRHGVLVTPEVAKSREDWEKTHGQPVDADFEVTDSADPDPDE